MVSIGHDDYQNNQFLRGDLNSLGKSSWILNKIPRTFTYLEQTCPEERANFFVYYNNKINLMQAQEVFKLSGGSLKTIHEQQASGEFWRRIPFISYTTRKKIAQEWWSQNSSNYRNAITKDRNLANSWLKDSILDAQELRYRIVVQPTTASKAKEDKRFAKRPEYEAEFHKQEQTLVLAEADKP